MANLAIIIIHKNSRRRPTVSVFMTVNGMGVSFVAFKRFKSGVFMRSIAEGDSRLIRRRCQLGRPSWTERPLPANDALYKRDQHFEQLMLVSCVSRHLEHNVAFTRVFSKPFVIETYLYDRLAYNFVL